ncbi:MAG: hypothetical protein JWQ43_3472 [Glaciihabitans sp.]|nr:hypothetical protein [Glaciihabitans sp.]
MALIHKAELHPSKNELLDAWAPRQSWFVGESPSPFSSVASYRYDDPAGEVGIETLLVRAGDGPVLQVPVTYRNAPLAGAEASLIGTMQHSVLGKRWTYDALGDPVYLAAVATAAFTGASQADQYVQGDAGDTGDVALEFREPTAVVTGSGSAELASFELAINPPIAMTQVAGFTVSTVDLVAGGSLRVAVVRVLDGAADGQGWLEGDVTPAHAAGEAALTGSWTDQPERQLMARVWLS